MLTSLSISNFAIIEHVDLEFSGGMTAITGETGVGKSIMLDALKFTMGSRASQELILKNNKRVDIRASFDLSKLPKALEWLKARDLDHGAECILRRIMTPEGRSRGYINGTPSTLTDLRNLSALLLHLHGQHGYHALLQPNLQRELLEHYAGSNNQARKVRQLWQACVQCQTKINNFHTSDQTQSARRHLLQYQIQEIDNLALQEGELESLEEEQSFLAKAHEHRGICERVQSALVDDDHGITQHLSTCLKSLSGNGIFSEVQSLLEDARIQIEEASTTMHHIDQTIDADPSRLPEIEQRLSQAYDIARKHRIRPDELLELQQKLHNELNQIEGEREDISQLEEQMQQLEHSFMGESEKLSKQRKHGAKKLEKAMTKLLGELGMATTQFNVDFSPLKSPDSSGIDKVVFQIQCNGDDTFADLDKVASGGELSRISLAVQIITAQNTGIKTLVFDEVDVGIGGATAEIVGRLLRQLGEKGQVLCITHQAQVASQAHYHLSVMKKQHDKQAINLVKPLNDPLREKEVARMIAGVEITGQALAHARDMIHRARA